MIAMKRVTRTAATITGVGAAIAATLYIWSLIAATPADVAGVRISLAQHVTDASKQLALLADADSDLCRRQIQSEINILTNRIIDINLKIPANRNDYPDLIRWEADLKKQVVQLESDRGKC